MIVETRLLDSGLYVCHVTSQLLDKSVLSQPLELDVQGKSVTALVANLLTVQTTLA